VSFGWHQQMGISKWWSTVKKRNLTKGARGAWGAEPLLEWGLENGRLGGSRQSSIVGWWSILKISEVADVVEAGLSSEGKSVSPY
jgi:hypothetical protein